MDWLKHSPCTENFFSEYLVSFSCFRETRVFEKMKQRSELFVWNLHGL